VTLKGLRTVMVGESRELQGLGIPGYMDHRFHGFIMIQDYNLHCKIEYMISMHLAVALNPTLAILLPCTKPQ
jgi:hypothetical protein